MDPIRIVWINQVGVDLADIAEVERNQCVYDETYPKVFVHVFHGAAFCVSALIVAHFLICLVNLAFMVNST